MLKPGDKVIVIFSDNHAEEGTIIKVHEDSLYCYVVNIKNMSVNCREGDVEYVQ